MKNILKKFAELKKLRIFAARLGNRNRFSGGFKFLDNIEREENIMFSIDNEVK